MVQVDLDHRRQGLATLVCKALAKQLAESGNDSCACIVTENESSIRMFERIGFKAVDDVVWFGTEIGEQCDWDNY